MWALNTCGGPNEIELTAAHGSCYRSFSGTFLRASNRHFEKSFKDNLEVLFGEPENSKEESSVAGAIEDRAHTAAQLFHNVGKAASRDSFRAMLAGEE
jgi:hypothetical protein